MVLDITKIRVTDHGAAISASAPPSKIFHYATNDTHATLAGVNYFDALASKFNAQKGDIILASVDLDGVPEFRAYMISAVAAGAVTVVQLSNA